LGDTTITSGAAMTHMLGLRTVKYVVTDLARARAWYGEAFGVAPYFDEPFYVGFNIGGYELGLDPDLSTQQPGAGGSTAYWGVTDVAATLKRLETMGARPHEPLQDVGEGIKVASVLDPFGNVVGLIENPHFKLP
jgi:predicted enzyme related to lactoylglutathione lyase